MLVNKWKGVACWMTGKFQHETNVSALQNAVFIQQPGGEQDQTSHGSR